MALAFDTRTSAVAHFKGRKIKESFEIPGDIVRMTMQYLAMVKEVILGRLAFSTW